MCAVPEKSYVHIAVQVENSLPASSSQECDTIQFGLLLVSWTGTQVRYTRDVGRSPANQEGNYNVWKREFNEAESRIIRWGERVRLVRRHHEDPP